MRHVQGSDRAQRLLLPASVEACVGADNPGRASEAFVDGFDLVKAGFVRAEARETGRPGCHPGDLLHAAVAAEWERTRAGARSRPPTPSAARWRPARRSGWATTRR